MERQATVRVDFKVDSTGLKQQLNSAVSGLGGRGLGETTGLANDRRIREQAEATKGLRDSMSELAAVAVTSGFAMTGFVAAASPDAINTLWGSVKMVSGEIGMMFLPAVVKVSGWLQTAAEYVRDLDEGTKGMVSTMAIGVAGFATAGFAIQKLGAVCFAAAGGFKAIAAGAGAAAMAVKGFLASLGPIGWITIGITAAASAFALFGESAADAAKKYESLLAIHDAGGVRGRMSRRQYQDTVPEDVRNRIEAAPAGNRSGVINEEIRAAEERNRTTPDREAAFVEMKEELRKAEEGWSGGSGIVRNWRRRNAINRVRQRHGMDAISGDVGEGSESFGSTWTDRDREVYASRYSGRDAQMKDGLLVQALRSIQSFGLPGEQRALLSSSFQSRQIGSAGNYYDSLAQKALSGGEQEKALEQLINRGNELLAQIANNTSPGAVRPPI